MSLSILRRAAVARSSATQSLAVAARRQYTKTEADPQLNGYPEPPDVSRARLPARGWDDMLTRRNIGETVHPHEEIVSMWGPDAPPIDPHTALRRFLIVASGFVAGGFLINAIVPEPKWIRREYPFDGLVKELGGNEELKARPEAVDTDN